jgi:DNA polymerase II small subunit
MDTSEILKFCMKSGLLVDKEVLGLFNETQDMESIKVIIERLKDTTHQNIITKSLFSENKEKVCQIFSTLPRENQQQLESLKIKLGLSIEISKEFTRKKEEFKPVETGGIKILSSVPNSSKKLEVADFTKYFRTRVMELKTILQDNSSLKNLVSINKLSESRQNISIIGIVSGKSITKNNNVIFEVEDLTGKIKVLIASSNEKLLKKADDVCLDSVLGFTGFGNREIIFASDLFFPDSSLPERKKSPVEEYALFIGDIHYGNKLFLESSFLKFIDYLNGKVPNTPEVEKIKYLFMVGDLIDGVGVYPAQERDLTVPDIEEQFLGFADLLSKINPNIQIIISPGNHDGVRLMEPQPLLNEKFAWRLYNMKNVIFTGNPALVSIGATGSFSGFNVLTYHGVSFHYYANTVPRLIKEQSLKSPNKIMNYLLQNRHLAPSHASIQYYPSSEDYHFIKEVPDILVSGHTHKSAVSYYNNILVISLSSWMSKTPYQEKMGNEPDFCKVPLFNLKTGAIKILDFEDYDKKEELKVEVKE